MLAVTSKKSKSYFKWLLEEPIKTIYRKFIRLDK